MNIEIMRAFVRMRHLFATPGEIIVSLEQLAETVRLHDGRIEGIMEWIRKLSAPPPVDTPKRRIGFTAPENEHPAESAS